MTLQALSLSLGAVVLAGGCGVAASRPATGTPKARIEVAGTGFRQPDGSPFVWRGITAFRLVEQVASGQQAEARAFLDWAAARGITVVRVLAMARHLFQLEPEEGLRALPALLEMAGARGIHVEIVALADTAGLLLDLDAHIIAIGRIAAGHPNAFVEIANEPFHSTHDPAVQDRATLARLAALVPSEVLVAYGSDVPDDSGGGDYVTVHMPRGGEPWDHVLALAGGRALVERYRRPVVSDEPIGAAAGYDSGRRDNAPGRFGAAAILTRMTGMHATFHYEGGLHGSIPEGIELECFDAWREGLDLLPEGVERAAFRVLPAARGAAFESRLGTERWVLTVNGADPPKELRVAKRWQGSALSVTR